jgi:hypothetical protein
MGQIQRAHSIADSLGTVGFRSPSTQDAQLPPRREDASWSLCHPAAAEQDLAAPLLTLVAPAPTTVQVFSVSSPLFPSLAAVFAISKPPLRQIEATVRKPLKWIHPYLNFYAFLSQK